MELFPKIETCYNIRYRFPLTKLTIPGSEPRFVARSKELKQLSVRLHPAYLFTRSFRIIWRDVNLITTLDGNVWRASLSSRRETGVLLHLPTLKKKIKEDFRHYQRRVPQKPNPKTARVTQEVVEEDIYSSGVTVSRLYQHEEMLLPPQGAIN